uniref:Uncharacterized protein n=1 Tax=Alexandrium monilatum TaxID=311494 RepID=A0A7S4ST47_9DINO
MVAAHTSPAEELVPSWCCYGDAELLDWLWLHQRPTKQFSSSPADAEREHSKAIFQDLIAKHETCHEALFGLGRVAVLEQRYEEGASYLREALGTAGRDALCLAWLAWAVLLASAGHGLLRHGTMLLEARELCHEALALDGGLALALQCLVHVLVAMPLSVGTGAQSAGQLASRLARVNPTSGLVVLARLMLSGGQGQAAAGMKALRAFLAEAPMQGQEAARQVAATLLHRCLQQDPLPQYSGVPSARPERQRGPRAQGMAYEPRLVATKLLALDTLWRHLLHVASAPAEAAEVALLAAGSFRSCPPAWQRAVVLALKALAVQGQWDECWRLAAAELGFALSREVLYQCGRLAYFDGRSEAIDAYLPHLTGLLPLVPASVQPDVHFWMGMLHHKRGRTLVAVQVLERALPALQGEDAGKVDRLRMSKAARAKKVLSGASKLQSDARRIYEVSNAVWRAAMGKPERSEERHTDAGRAPPNHDESVFRRPPGYVPPEQREASEAESGSTEGEEEEEPALAEDAECGEVAEVAKARDSDEETIAFAAAEMRIAAEEETVFAAAELRSGSQEPVAASEPAPGDEGGEGQEPSDEGAEAEDAGGSRWMELLRRPLPPELSRLPRPALRGLLEARLRAAACATAWNIWDAWSAARALRSIEAEDAFLGTLCRGRLALMRGEVAEAERLWSSAAERCPRRVEPVLELWRLHSCRGSHRLAVLSAKKAVDLLGNCDIDSVAVLSCSLLSDGKVWGAACSRSLSLRWHAHLLLAKSLWHCGLWEDAWRVLDSAAGEAEVEAATVVSPGAEAAFLYQQLKVAVRALEDLFARQAKDTDLCREDSGQGAFGGVIQPWLDRGESALKALSAMAVELSRENCLRCAFWRARLERCLAAAECFRKCKQVAGR